MSTISIGPWLCFLIATLLTYFLGFSYPWSLDGYPLKRKSTAQLLGLISCKDPACNHYHTFDTMAEHIQCLFLPHHHATPPLLRIPGEIRNSIYRLLLLTYPYPIDFARRLDHHLTLNKQIYAEARTILYTENEFIIMARSWPRQGGILNKAGRFRKEDVELISDWTFQTAVYHTTNHLDPVDSSRIITITPQQRVYLGQANIISLAIIKDMLELAHFLHDQRPQGLQLTFMYLVGCRQVRCTIQDWLRPVHEMICAGKKNLVIVFRLATVACDNLFEWFEDVYTACDRLWELRVTLDLGDEATRDRSRQMTEQFSRTLCAVGFFRNMITETWERSADGTLESYMIAGKPCQGCKRRFARTGAQGRCRLAHCTCGLTEADISWALTTGYWKKIRGRVDWMHPVGKTLQLS